MSEMNETTFTQRGLRVSVILLAVAVTVGVLATGGVAAQETIEECGVELDTEGQTYQLEDNLTNETVDTCIEITADDVVLDGNNFEVDGVNQTEDSAGIFAEGFDNLTVKNFGNVTGWETGIAVGESENITLTDNTANENAGVGIAVFTDFSTLSGNTANGNEFGISLFESSNNTVTDNTANENAVGVILLQDSNDNTLTDNTAENNEVRDTDDVPFTGVGILLLGSSGNEIGGEDAEDGNIANDNEEVGILSTGGEIGPTDTVDTLNNGEAGNYIQNNEANDNVWGIILLGTEGDEVIDNEASRNGIEAEQTTSGQLPGLIDDFPGIGIKVAESLDATVEDNVANENDFAGISLLFSAGTDVLNNEVHQNGFGEDFQFGGEFASGIGVFLNEEDSDNVIHGNTATENQVGITLFWTVGNSLSENTATDNEVGIQTVDALQNTFVDDTSRDNEVFDFVDMPPGIFGDAVALEQEVEPAQTEDDLNTVENLDIGSSTKPNTEISFQTVNFGIRGTDVAPPENPDAAATGRYFEALPLAEELFLQPRTGDEPVNGELETQQEGIPVALLDIDLHYEDGDVDRIDESSLRMWALNQSEETNSWEELVGIPEEEFDGLRFVADDSSVDTDRNAVNWRVSIEETEDENNEVRETTPQAMSGDLSLAQEAPELPLFGAFGEGTDCIDRRSLARGQEDEECPFDRQIQRGDTREDLDERSGRSGRGEHRDSATERRSRGR